MGRAVYKKDVSGYLDLDLCPIHKEAECDNLGVDPNWKKFDNEHWLDHDAIEKDVADAVRATLEKHGVEVRSVKFTITEDMDDSWDI